MMIPKKRNKKPIPVASRKGMVLNPVKRFIKAPAARIIKRFHHFWFVKARGSSDSSSSSIAQ